MLGHDDLVTQHEPAAPPSADDPLPPPRGAPGIEDATPLADSIAVIGDSVKDVNILISYEVVRLLSEQLYASPVKAVEELVVNSWDAGATNCSVLVDVADLQTIGVFDNGCGMDEAQLTDLWHIGKSHKTSTDTHRKQIGKFGIGKLASYAVASRATYISKAAGKVLAVTINFDDLASHTDPETGNPRPLPLSIRRLPDNNSLQAITQFDRVKDRLLIPDLDETPSWTLVVLEQLKERASALTGTRRLKWVLETAMPYASDFVLHLNGDLVESNKRTYEPLLAFKVGELSDQRLSELNRKLDKPWTRTGGSLVSADFPSGVSGDVVVTKTSLYKAGGKSEDLGRSHGFFVRVRKRLVNETDPLFGARPLSFSTWYSFAAEVEADDLNRYITASRDDFEQSDLKPKLRDLLIALFNEARDRRQSIEDEQAKKNKEKLEGERESVSRKLMERSLADALSASGGSSGSRNEEGSEGDDNFADEWSHLDDTLTDDEMAALLESLYDESAPRRKYRIRYAALGDTVPFVVMNAAESTVTLNEDHAIVQEHAEKPDGRYALETFSFAEVMLESYLREAGVEIEIIREILSKRDLLLESLARDEVQSLQALAQLLRENQTNSSDSKALEIAVVGALRGLGFAASHVSGSKAPDGVAGYQVYGTDSKRIIIETKASSGTPSLGHIDIGGVHSHAVAVKAVGAILVSPSFPGEHDPESEISLRAQQQKVSCWTVEQLARVVERAERRHINASDVEAIILSDFAPLQVSAAVNSLLTTPAFDRTNLYRAILDALELFEGKLTDIQRNLSLIAGHITLRPEFTGIKFKDVAEAVIDIAHISRGLLHVTGDTTDGLIVINGDIAELRRRAAPLTELSEAPRRQGSFRERADRDRMRTDES